MDRAFLRASLLGAAAALVLFVGLLTYGGGALLAEDQLGGFYEAQTRALFDGHLDVDPDAVTFEGFRVGDRTYIYQGPVPALLRMPVMAVTDRFDGRLTRISMLAAYLLALGAIIQLGWRMRVLVRGTGPVGRFEAASAGIVTFGAGASTLLFLGARAWVYHEALLWGAALALASFAALVRWLVDPTRGWRGLAWAAGLAGAALLSRPSVGAGPVAGARAWSACASWSGCGRPRPARRQAWARVAGLFLGALLPLVGLRRDQPGEVRFPVRAADRQAGPGVVRPRQAGRARGERRVAVRPPVRAVGRLAGGAARRGGGAARVPLRRVPGRPPDRARGRGVRRAGLVVERPGQRAAAGRPRPDRRGGAGRARPGRPLVRRCGCCGSPSSVPRPGASGCWSSATWRTATCRT